VIDFADRVFHVEALKGGMDRLLLRSDRTSHSPYRIEVLFMYVKFLAIATTLEGLVIKDLGPLEESVWQGWRLDASDLRVFEVRSSAGVGCIVAGSVASQTSEAGPSDPSGFFMMD